ncbi:amino acid adenylation domain-containing protein [Vibrio sp. S4M6]|uniref:amino acid adenylation domain-containing protein n=1 Tax=Vibrio sinus TaxID=2946865 RepID=UPI00202A3C02|nr:amino acid adenylation domain-containing protein [Vibrio sinus]MCL9781791.1 amino acid adenylation domain-containing protein [Vibrio sinus]
MKSFYQLFSEHVLRCPDAIAVQDEHESLTYIQLDRRSIQLASYLQSHLITKGSRVALLMNRSVDLVVSMLAVARMGAAYIPLDPTFPAERLIRMLTDSQADLVITKDDFTGIDIERLKQTNQHLDLRQYSAEAFKHEHQFQEVESFANQLAYIIYTSGSTGQPKGVMISHGSLSNFLLSMAKEPGLVQGDLLLSVTTHSFDIFGLEIWLPLITGGQCYLCPDKSVNDAQRLVALIRDLSPALIQATPATWSMLFQAGWTNEEKVKVLCGGDVMPRTLKEHFDRHGCNVWNMYGPTETTIWSTICQLPSGKDISIGKPIDNTQVYVVRDDISLCDTEEPGELCISGMGLAMGYWNNPELTAEKFIDNPFEPGERLYKTGDLAYWDKQGDLMHLGRLDHQVKVQGYRIELGDIEASLDQHLSIESAVVVARKNSTSTQLVAYLVSADGTEAVNRPDAKALKQYLLDRLPAYMVPMFFQYIDSIPLTPNGKVDRKDLSQRSISLRENDVPSVSNITQFIVSEWSSLLDLEGIDDEAVFTEIGGNSIAANAFIIRLNSQFAIEMTLEGLVRYETPKSIANQVQLMIRNGANKCDKRSKNTGSTSLDASQSEAESIGSKDVAIIGMAGRFPGASSLDEFWNNIATGRSVITEAPEDRLFWLKKDTTDNSTPFWGGFISNAFDFDPGHFHISPKEAAIMDPQQRLMLTCVWHALEDARIAPAEFSKNKTGVFIAAAPNAYAERAIRNSDNVGYFATSHLSSMIPGRVSYVFDLIGPSEVVEATCSSSLLAVHRAVKSIREGECEQAIVGGVNLLLSADYHNSYDTMGLLSHDGMTRSFQQDGRGYVRSEAVAAIILKPLHKAIEDGDEIHAVIKGTGVSHGGKASSLAAPNPRAINMALSSALQDSGLPAESIDYLEMHGTGSVIGDNVEFEATNNAYVRQSNNTEYHTLGSLKPVMGHAEVASGMAALFKVILAMRHGVMPAIPGLANSAKSVSGADFHLSDENKAWNKNLRRAGITSYGFGAAAHLILQNASTPHSQNAKPISTLKSDINSYLFVFSARTETQLEVLLDDILSFFKASQDLRALDLAYSLAVARQPMKMRFAVLASSVKELEEQIRCYLHILRAQSDPDHFNLPKFLFCSKGLPGAMGAYVNASGQEASLAIDWVGGGDASFSSLYQDKGAARIALPPYPLQQKTYRLTQHHQVHVSRSSALDTQDNQNKAKRICVIGAGPGGLVMAKSLLEEGQLPTIYESQVQLGGVWNLYQHKNSGVYKTTRFQNSKDTSFFSDFYPEMAKDMFPGVSDVRAYLEAYAEHFDLKRYITLDTRVVSVKQQGEKWKVVVESGGSQRTETYDGVALCAGRYHTPRKARIPGLDNFKGQVIHAGQYYDNDLFKGKRVLVVGNGVSGMDIAGEASKVADKVFWSIRSKKFILPRMVGFLPNDFVSPAYLLMPERDRAQRNLDRLEQAVPDYHSSMQGSGMMPSLEEFRVHPFIHINEEVAGLVDSGRITTLYGQVEQFNETSCIHEDRSQVIADIDIVVLCTGYDTRGGMRCLEGIDPAKDFAMGLFYREEPMLFNQSALQEIGVIGTFPYLEIVSRWYAQVASGNYRLSQTELSNQVDPNAIIMVPVTCLIIGIKLGLVPDPRKAFKSFWSYLASPCFPAQYRLYGAHTSAKATDVLERSRKRAFIDDEAREPEILNVKLRIIAGLGDEAMGYLHEIGEISAEEYSEAKALASEAITLDWDSQFLHPIAPSKGQLGQPNAIDPSTIRFHELARRLANKELSAQDFVKELELQVTEATL